MVAAATRAANTPITRARKTAPSTRRERVKPRDVSTDAPCSSRRS